MYNAKFNFFLKYVNLHSFYKSVLASTYTEENIALKLKAIVTHEHLFWNRISGEGGDAAII